jgi:hypothetical protein
MWCSFTGSCFDGGGIMSALPADAAIETIKDRLGKEFDVCLANAVAFDLPKRTGLFVYFLFDKGKIVYIGQTNELNSRVHSHTKNKEFDRVVAIPVDGRFINAVEKGLIKFFSPPMNRMCNTKSDGCCSEWSLATRVAWNRNHYPEIYEWVQSCRGKDLGGAP